MGWNSYNTFCCEPTEALIREVAEALVDSGLRDAGYVYVNIDDGWMAKERGPDGQLRPHPDKFPGGLRAVTDYLHARGLKAGIYLGAGQRTYGDYPGSLGHEADDARLIAEAGFDYLKYDYRALDDDPPRASVADEYRLMRSCLEEAGRPMVFSICEHGRSAPWEWGRSCGHLWRTTPDIKDGWEGPITWGFGCLSVLDRSGGRPEHAGPGGWNDLDMLIVGLNGKIGWQGPGCTEAEYRSHFALWCLSASPLLIGCDPRTMDDVSRRILMNRDLITANQDSLGVQGRPLRREGGLELWKKALSGGAMAVGLFNRRSESASISADREELGIPTDGEFILRDAWSGNQEFLRGGSLSCRVEAHDIAVFIIRPVPEGRPDRPGSPAAPL
jgi:alpha-galactosidase